MISPMTRLLVLVLSSIAACGGMDLPNIFEKTFTIPEINGSVCAYADFNGDRFTDLLMYVDRKLVVHFQDTKSFLVLNQKTEKNLTIDIGDFEEVACAIGDLNGDGLADVVVSTRDGDDDWNIRYFFRVSEEKGFSEGTAGKITLKDQVATVDVTGDGMHDIVGVNKEGTLFCQEGSHDDTALSKDCSGIFPGWSGPLRRGHPIIFGDITNDLSAEIIFMREKDDTLVPEIWRRAGSSWELFPIPLPTPSFASLKHTLAPLLADIDLDRKMDLIIPLCKDAACTILENVQSIHLDDSGKWSEWNTNSVSLGPGTMTLVEEVGTWARIRIGDYNLDGYPDLLATVKRDSGFNKAVVLENLANTDADPPEPGKARRFVAPESDLVMPALALGHAESSHFFDFEEDGFLDLLIQWKLPESTHWTTGLIVTAANAKQDVTFLKVQTFAPLKAGEDIKSGKGVPWGGSCVTYEMETIGLGSTRTAVDCQLPSTSHKAGLTPTFSLLGLGRWPNFVDVVTVTVPRATDDSNAKTHQQKQIVPNARMMVQPPTVGKDGGVGHWILRLYLTPSSLIASSLAVMASVCSLLLLVVLLLHFREKKFDRIERQAQSHRFHFDAM